MRAGATWDTVYPSRQPSQVVAEAAVTQAALTQQQGLPKQRSQRYRKLVHGLSARLSTLCHLACLAPKTGHTGESRSSVVDKKTFPALVVASSAGLSSII